MAGLGLILVLLVSLISIGAPIFFGIYLEDSDDAIGRGRFVLATLVTAGLGACLGLLIDQLPMLVLMLMAAGINTFYLRRVVRRLRDMGKGHNLAYLSLVPLFNMAFMIWLCVAPSRRRPDEERIASLF